MCIQTYSPNIQDPLNAERLKHIGRRMFIQMCQTFPPSVWDGDTDTLWVTCTPLPTDLFIRVWHFIPRPSLKRFRVYRSGKLISAFKSSGILGCSAPPATLAETNYQEKRLAVEPICREEGSHRIDLLHLQVT
jgi:hypothetical protein